MTLTIILRLIDNIFRRPIRYLLPIAILGFVGYATASTVDEYRSEGTVAVSETTFLASLTDVRSDDGFSFSTAADVATEEIVGLLQTDAFTTSVLNVANGTPDGGPYTVETLEAVRDAISVEPLSNTFLRIQAETTTPTAAQSLVLAVIESFVDWQISADLEQTVIAEQFFVDLADSLAIEVNAAEAGLSAFLLENPDPVTGDRPTAEQLQLTELQADLDAATLRYEDALSKQREAELATIQTQTDTRQAFLTVDSPNLPSEPVSRLTSLLVRVMLFAILGTTASVAVAIITTVVDTSIRFPAEVRERLDLEILAVVPKTR